MFQMYYLNERNAILGYILDILTEGEPKGGG